MTLLLVVVLAREVVGLRIDLGLQHD